MVRVKKKRIFWYVCLAAFALLGWQAGWWAAFLTAGMFLLALGGLAVFRWLAEDIGMDQLRRRAESAGASYAAMVSALQGRRKQQGDCVRFVVYGDTRSNRATASMLLSRMAEDTPDVVFHTGDVVRFGTPREFIRNHLELLPLLNGVPVFCVPGNHDRGFRRGFRAFNVMAGDTRFSFDFGGCRFVGFNNSGPGRVTETDLAWLDRELGREGAVHKFVFFHIPPAFFEAAFARDSRRRGFRKLAESLHETLKRHGVEEVFMAHIHGFATHMFDGVRYTLTAGGGAPLSGRLDASGQTFHYLLLEADKDGVRRKIVRPVSDKKTGGEWIAEPYGD